MMSTDTGRYVPMPLGLLFPYLECLYPLCLPKAWWLYRDLFFFFLSFLGPHMQHMEVPRLGVKLQLQLPASATATGTRALSRFCDLHHSSWQCLILNLLSEARN